MRKSALMKTVCLAAIAMAYVVNLHAEVAKPIKRSLTTKLPGIWSATPPQERLKARRVAEMDAYRALAERVYGFRLAGGTIVYDFMLQSDRIRNRMRVLLKGAVEVEPAEYTEDGIVQVVYGVTLREVYDIIEKNIETVNDPPLREVSAEIKRQRVVEKRMIEALGNGALPNSPGLRMVRAKRAAEMDAYRKMAERLVGVMIDSKTSVRDFCLKNDVIQGSVSAFLRGLKPVQIIYNDDGTCEVTMQLKIREVVETIESLIKMERSAFTFNKEIMRKVNTNINEKTFRVTGVGAPNAPIAYPGSVGAAVDYDYTYERKILKRVISRDIVVD